MIPGLPVSPKPALLRPLHLAVGHRQVGRTACWVAAMALLASTALGQPVPPASDFTPEPAPAAPAPAPPVAAPAPAPAAPVAAPAPAQPPPAPPPVAPATQPAAVGPAPAAAPAAPASGPVAAPLAPAPPPPAQFAVPERRKRKTAALVLRLGYAAAGSGTLELQGECDGACPFSPVTDDARADPAGAFGFGLEMLSAPHEMLRLGTAFHFVPSLAVDTDVSQQPAADSDRHLGSDLSWTFDFEVQIGTGEGVAAAMRARIGPWFIFPAGALRRDKEAFDSLCDDPTVATDCNPSRLTRVGWTYGMGAGPVFELSAESRLRADLILQYYSAKLFGFEGEGPGWTGRQSYWYDGYRFWLSLAIELWG
jgi:hypothetical protein